MIPTKDHLEHTVKEHIYCLFTYDELMTRCELKGIDFKEKIFINNYKTQKSQSNSLWPLKL